jgi:hypothetical protein
MTNKPEQYEKEIRERRIVEATKKGFLGQNSKLLIILKNLGEPIISQSEGGMIVADDRTVGTVGMGVTTHYLEDPYYDPDDDIYHAVTPEELVSRIPTESANNPDGSQPTPAGWEWREPSDSSSYTVSQIGWIFDGLSQGMHMEIQYMNSRMIQSETLYNILSSSYKGREVYCEVRGDLQKYIPTPEWEEWVERLFKIAKKKELQKRKNANKESSEEVKKEKLAWLKRLRDNWGI